MSRADVDALQFPEEGAMVVCAHDMFTEGWLLGQVVDTSDENDGWVHVWVYGSYRMSAEPHSRSYKSAYVDPNDNKQVYTRRAKERYQRHLVWVELAQVILESVQLVGKSKDRLSKADVAKIEAALRPVGHC